MELRRLLSGRFFLLLGFAGIAYWNFQTDHAIAGTLILAVVLSVGIVWFQQTPAFTPFRVHILALRPLLFEFKLATEEQLKTANEARKPKGSEPAAEGDDDPDIYTTPGHSVLYEGVRFTVLKAPSEGSGLVFWDDFDTFSTDIDQEFWFAEFQRPVALPLLGSEKDCPGVHLGWTHEGLVISVIDSADREEYTREYNKRRAALIPWQEFSIGGWRSAKRRDAAMIKNGWSREEHLNGRLQELRHKYCEVHWNFI